MTDPLVRVAYAQNQPEAEMIQGLLRENGLESIAKRSMGADVPDFLAAGARDILVPASRAQQAREVLGTPEPDPPPVPETADARPWWRRLF
jgi:Putative prokaryotic signal transducing protein